MPPNSGTGLSPEERGFLGELRNTLATRQPIHPDWDFKIVESDLDLLSRLLQIKCMLFCRPSQEFQDSGILSHEPNRSPEALARLPDFKKLQSITIPVCPKLYSPSVLAAAEYLFQCADMDSPKVWLLEYNAGLPHVLFLLLQELAKIHKARQCIHRWSTTERALCRLSSWQSSIEERKVAEDPFDPESDFWLKTKSLLEKEMSREEPRYSHPTRV